MPPLEAIVEQLDVPALCMPNEPQRMLVVVFPIGPALRPSFTLMASARHDLFCPYELTHEHAVTGELSVNPLYRVERRGGSSILTLTFPTPEYEAEFGECRRYLPDRFTVEVDLTGPIPREKLGAAYEELRDRRVLINAPVGYC